MCYCCCSCCFCSVGNNRPRGNTIWPMPCSSIVPRTRNMVCHWANNRSSFWILPTEVSQPQQYCGMVVLSMDLAYSRQRRPLSPSLKWAKRRARGSLLSSSPPPLLVCLVTHSIFSLALRWEFAGSWRIEFHISYRRLNVASSNLNITQTRIIMNLQRLFLFRLCCSPALRFPSINNCLTPLILNL